MGQAGKFLFGMVGGRAVELLKLDNGRLACQIITLGAAIRTLQVPDHTGRRVDVVLGYDTPDEYQKQELYFGAVVGRFANRIANGQFSLDGEQYQLTCNDRKNHLHGGANGFSQRIWSVESYTQTEAVLTLLSPDGEEGYPGNLCAQVTYRLEESGLCVHFWAESDRDTICSLSSHSYFNLDGHDAGSVLQQTIALDAPCYTPVRQDGVPTGAVLPVEGTPMDLRGPVPIGAQIEAAFDQLEWSGGYDHNFVLSGPAGQLRRAARVWAKKTGIAMQVETTLPGVHVYTANHVQPGHPGKTGSYYGPRHGICLETQYFPDGPNWPNFPSCTLRAGEVWEHTTRFLFSLEGAKG